MAGPDLTLGRMGGGARIGYQWGMDTALVATTLFTLFGLVAIGLIAEKKCAEAARAEREPSVEECL